MSSRGSGWWEDAKGRAAGPAAKKPRRRLFRQPIPREHVNSPAPQAHRSICYDDTSGGDALDNRELRVVFAGICALLGRKIDLLGMDACLMNMVEVAWQLRESVNMIVGSEIEEPFDGWPYTEILSRLTARPRQDAATLARWIVKTYLLSYQGKGETVTQSALDADRISDVMTKVDALSGALLAALETDSNFIASAWRRSPRFYDDNYIDLACFAKNLKKKAGADLLAKADDLLAALKPGKGRPILLQGKKTLLAWNDRFQKAWAGLAGRYDLIFKRMWEYYLLSYAGAFRARHVQLRQIVFSKHGVPGGYETIR